MRAGEDRAGATAVQVVWSSRRGSGEIEHLGSVHDEGEGAGLKAAARQRIAAGQLELGLGLEPGGGGPLPITSSRMGHLLDALKHAYRCWGWKTPREATRCSGTLHVKYARAAARLGDGESARQAIAAAQDAREREHSDAVLALGGVFGLSLATQSYFSGSALAEIDGAESEAAEHLERAVALYDARPGPLSSTGSAAGTVQAAPWPPYA